MGRFIVFAICVLPMFGAEIRIDHVTVAGSHLESMRSAFTAAAGVPTEYGGRHANHATEMALTSFPDGSYIELMAVQPDADPAALRAQPWARFLEKDAGPCAFAVRVADLAAAAARLHSEGIQVKAPERSGRTRPDGTRLEWEIADVGPAPRGSLLPFLIRDITPRENRAYLKGKPTTERLRGISKVVIAVHDLDPAIQQYRSAFELPAPRLQQDANFGATLAWFEGTPIVLAKTLNEDSWLSRRVREYGDAPCAFVLSGARGITGTHASNWFGSAVSWSDEAALEWRLGFEITSP